MSERATHYLALILTNGIWSPDAVCARLRDAFEIRNTLKWPSRLTELLFATFHHDHPTCDQMRQFLRSSESMVDFVERAAAQSEKMAASMDMMFVAPPGMAATEAAKKWSVPSITTSAQLASLLGLTCRRMDFLADRKSVEFHVEREPLRNYRYMWLRKPSGGARLLECPKEQLKSAQRWILRHILHRIPCHDAAHAFVANRSARTSALKHVLQDVVLRIDLREFFTSIPAGRVAGIFRTAGYPSHIVSVLTGLCTNTTWRGILDRAPEFARTGDKAPGDLKNQFVPHLPQGAPTSPTLANLAAWSLDCRLSGLAKQFRAKYTRYADDLIFSGDRRFSIQLSRFRVLALAITHNEGFEIRHRKTKAMLTSEQQIVTGLVVNAKPAVPRRDYEQLKAILTNTMRHGPQSQNRRQHPDFRAHLQGKIAWVRTISPVRAERLQRIFDAISWPGEVTE